MLFIQSSAEASAQQTTQEEPGAPQTDCNATHGHRRCDAILLRRLGDERELGEGHVHQRWVDTGIDEGEQSLQRIGVLGQLDLFSWRGGEVFGERSICSAA